MTTEHSLAAEAGWTMGQQIERQREAQARVRLEAEVREAARRRGANRTEVDALVQESWTAFAIVKGEACAVMGDGKTVVRAEDGVSRLTIEGWVEKKVPTAAPGASRGPTVEPLPPVARNPWRRSSWNLTEQMRLMRRDWESARRLRDEAAAQDL